MKKKLLCAAMIMVMVLGTLVMTGCGSSSDKSADKDTLVVGLDDAFAPMGFRDENGDLVGFDIDLANAVGDELGMKVDFKPIDWDAKELELESGTIDCVWNGMSATPERKKSMALSDKYLNNKIVLMALKTSDTDVKNWNAGRFLSIKVAHLQ